MSSEDDRESNDQAEKAKSDLERKRLKGTRLVLSVVPGRSGSVWMTGRSAYRCVSSRSEMLVRVEHLLLDGFTVTGGGLVLLSLVSMYAFARGWLKQLMTVWSSNLGLVRARASGKMYPVAISTDCWKRSCSRTMKPVFIVEAFPRMYSQFCMTWVAVIVPA